MTSASLLLPLAHVGHYTWTLYIPPVLIVVYSIFRTTRAERKAAREEEDEAGNRDRGGTR